VRRWRPGSVAKQLDESRVFVDAQARQFLDGVIEVGVSPLGRVGHPLDEIEDVGAVHPYEDCLRGQPPVPGVMSLIGRSEASA
jgi:hypothetical protein